MLLSSKFLSLPGLRRGLLVLGALYALGGTAQAQNLDEGKSAAQLFANGCETCHRSPAPLARGRSRAALYQFLQEHYSTSANTAGELASYLASFNPPPSTRSRPAANTPAHPTPRTHRSATHRHAPTPSTRHGTGGKPANPTAGRSLP